MEQEPIYALQLQKIVKVFPGVRALDQASFEVETGEIHGLVGENGAGKSTLIKIIAGIYTRDEGEMRIHGNACGDLSPHQVEAMGIQFIHQDINLVPDFSVCESIFLGQELTYSFLPLVNKQKMKKEAESFIESTLGVSLPGDKLIRDLSVAERQLVQIAKALLFKPTIVAFDEPTAPLARREVEQLFRIIRNLKEQGITIIYISHYLSEIAEICDKVTVLRNGKNISTLPMASTNLNEIVNLMLGRNLAEMYPHREYECGDPLLKVENLSRTKCFKDVNFQVCKGEVVGITGLLGSGIHDLANVLYGLRKANSGSIVFKEKIAKNWSPTMAVKNGMGMVPKDRRAQSLVLNMSVNDNINLASLEKVSKSSFISRRRAMSRANTMIENLKIKTPKADSIVRYLSGGNQQKTVIGRWLSSDARLYILDEPTIGVDVGAKIEIYTLINQLVKSGAGMLFVSTDIPELVGMCDRILVMFRGNIVKEILGSEATPDNVLFWATGGKE